MDGWWERLESAWRKTNLRTLQALIATFKIATFSAGLCKTETHVMSPNHEPRKSRLYFERDYYQLSSLMDNHAMSVLTDAESWEWPVSRRILKTEKQDGHYEAITLKPLSWLIKESQRFCGTILDQFCEQVIECHPKREENGVKIVLV